VQLPHHATSASEAAAAAEAAAVEAAAVEAAAVEAAAAAEAAADERAAVKAAAAPLKKAEMKCTGIMGDRCRGLPWTEDEHGLFLIGLAKYGKGDWRSISRFNVKSRTPTQVASHAQKYFIRLNSMNNKAKRRTSIHDITSVTKSDLAPAQKPMTLTKPRIVRRMPAMQPGMPPPVMSTHT
jgi:SHAQKYF class myb-like DNA-binding protein